MGTNVFKEASTAFKQANLNGRHNTAYELGIILAEMKKPLAQVSPYASGDFSRSWRTSKVVINAGRTGTIASGSAYNLVHYGATLEEGAKQGDIGHSWAVAWASPENTRRLKASSSGLNIVASNGRIWSTEAIGGVINKVVTPQFEIKVTHRLADALIIGVRKGLTNA